MAKPPASLQPELFHASHIVRWLSDRINLLVSIRLIQ